MVKPTKRMQRIPEPPAGRDVTEDGFDVEKLLQSQHEAVERARNATRPRMTHEEAMARIRAKMAKSQAARS